jgi:hypothetical protein
MWNEAIKCCFFHLLLGNIDPIAMKKNLILQIFLAILSFTAFGQSDTTEVNTDTSDMLPRNFKKGFYTSYSEFVKNEPAVVRSFTTIKKTTSKKKIANGIYKASYELAKGEAGIKEDIWGFADDSLFYVRIFASLFHKDYWKLECSGGKYPFAFVNIDQSGGYLGSGFLANEIAPIYEIYVMDKNGKFKQASTKYLKSLFADSPEILKEYLDSSSKNSNKTKKEFLVRFNLQQHG